MVLSRRRLFAMSGGLALGALVSGEVVAWAQTPPAAGPFRGAGGKSAQGPFALNAGVTVVRGQHNGTANFIVALSQPSPGLTLEQARSSANYAESHLVYNDIGRLKGGVAVIVAQPSNNYYLDVDASGAYELSVEQPLPETVQAVDQRSFSGQGQQVTPYFSLPAGSYTVTAQADASAARLTVWLYALDDLGGGAVSTNFDGRLIDADVPSAPNTAGFTASTDAIYVCGVFTDISDQSKWTLSIN